MNKKTKLTKEQAKKHKKIIGEFNDQLNAEEGNEAIDLKTAKDMPDTVWACTPEVKLKSTQPRVDIQLTPEQTRGGVISIVRTGSNRIKICSVVQTKHLKDGVAEAKAEAKKNPKKKPKKRAFEIKDLPPKKSK